MNATKMETNKMEIKRFTEDSFDFLWNKQLFFNKQVNEKFAKRISSNLSREDKNEVKHFTEDIGRAVRASMVLLREYLRTYFQNSVDRMHPEFSKKIFKRELKLEWLRWISRRKNIFVKVLDTLAIIAEAFLFLDRHKNVTPDIDDCDEWFKEWFDEYLAREFFHSGGWKHLDTIAIEKYRNLYDSVKSSVIKGGQFKYIPMTHECSVTPVLRNSHIIFPIPKSMVCKNCKQPDDDKVLRKIVYVRPKQVESLFKDSTKVLENKTEQSLEVKSASIRGKATKDPLQKTDLKYSNAEKLSDSSRLFSEVVSSKVSNPLNQVSPSTKSTSDYPPLSEAKIYKITEKPHEQSSHIELDTTETLDYDPDNISVEVKDKDFCIKYSPGAKSKTQPRFEAIRSPSSKDKTANIKGSSISNEGLQALTASETDTKLETKHVSVPPGFESAEGKIVPKIVEDKKKIEKSHSSVTPEVETKDLENENKTLSLEMGDKEIHSSATNDKTENLEAASFSSTSPDNKIDQAQGATLPVVAEVDQLKISSSATELLKTETAASNILPKKETSRSTTLSASLTPGNILRTQKIKTGYNIDEINRTLLHYYVGKQYVKSKASTKTYRFIAEEYSDSVVCMINNRTGTPVDELLKEASEITPRHKISPSSQLSALDESAFDCKDREFYFYGKGKLQKETDDNDSPHSSFKSVKGIASTWF